MRVRTFNRRWEQFDSLFSSLLLLLIRLRTQREHEPTPLFVAAETAMRDFLALCHNISGESFESFTSRRLHDRYRHMTCFAFFDISHDAGFALMRAADDFALRAVLQFSN
jgi:hypothetical protein